MIAPPTNFKDLNNSDVLFAEEAISEPEVTDLWYWSPHLQSSEKYPRRIPEPRLCFCNENKFIIWINGQSFNCLFSTKKLTNLPIFLFAV